MGWAYFSIRLSFKCTLSAKFGKCFAEPTKKPDCA